MNKDILYTWALDENQKPIHINDALKGEIYYCPGCKSEFILRKSGNTGKWSKRPHFAHKDPNRECSGESYLHNTFIKLLFALLERYRSEGKELNVIWTCKACSKQYSKFNLLAITARIETEYYLEGYRPDIALLDSEGKVIAAIEIVYTHEPEETVLLCYKKHGITLIQINIFFEEDLDRVEEKIINPNIVNLCLNPQCPSFSNYEAGRNLIFSEVRCQHCGHLMLTCHVEANNVFGSIKVPYLTENEIRSAQSEGVRFR